MHACVFTVARECRYFLSNGKRSMGCCRYRCIVLVGEEWVLVK